MRKFFLFTIFSVLSVIITAQDYKTHQFTLIPEEDILNQPLSIELKGIDYYEDSTHIELFRVEGKKKIPLTSQLEQGLTDRLWFLPGGRITKGEKIIFEIQTIPGEVHPDGVITETDPEYFTILSGGKEILRYRHALSEAPEGTDPLYRRFGGYIHPLRSPSGKVLTCIRPDDHYHHFGIWNPWTKVFFEGREVDFWNLATGKGTVKYAGTLSTWSGELFGGFKVRHEHIDFTALGEDKTALNELWDVRVWNVNLEDRPVYIIDFLTTLSPATDSIVQLAAYRYGGGLGFRATPEWTSTTSSLLTSEGKTRKDADGTNARWCMITGLTDENQTSGIIFMSHPSNRAHPEPMRVWPEDINNGRGDLFFEFCPIRHKPWTLYPGKEYVLKYRLVVFDGTLSPESAEQLWRNYAFPQDLKKY